MKTSLSPGGEKTLPGSGRLGLISPSQEIRPKRIPSLRTLRARVTGGNGREERGFGSLGLLGLFGLGLWTEGNGARKKEKGVLKSK